MNSLEKIIVAIRAEFEDYIKLSTGAGYVQTTEAADTPSASTSTSTSTSPSSSPKQEETATRGIPIEGSQSNILFETLGSLGSVVSYAASFLPSYENLPSLPNPFSTNKNLTNEKVEQANDIVKLCNTYQLRAREFNKTDIDAINEFVESMLSDLSEIFRTKKTLAEGILSKYNNHPPSKYDAKLSFVTVFINELQNDSRLLCSMLKSELDPNKLRFESKEGVLSEDHECHKDEYKNLPLHIASFMYGNLLMLKIDTHKKKEKVLKVTDVLPDGPETGMKTIIEEKLINFLDESDAKSGYGAKTKLETAVNLLGALICNIDKLPDRKYDFIQGFKDQINIYSDMCQKFLDAVNTGLRNKKISDLQKPQPAQGTKTKKGKKLTV